MPLSRDDVIGKSGPTFEPVPGVVVTSPTATSDTAATTYRKTTVKAVNTTTTATDLLNGEITIGSNVIGATGMIRLTAFGDYLNNSGGTTNDIKFTVTLGGTTLFDTAAGAFALANSATREPWKLVVLITNTATNAQVCSLELLRWYTGASGGAISLTTGEGHTFQPAASSSLSYAVTLGFNTSSVDTVSAQALVLNVTNPSASASFETKLYSALVEII